MLETGLKGRKALITGAGSGIGLAIAKTLAEEGVNIAVASRNPDPQAIEEIRAHGVRVLRMSVDVSKEDEVIGMVKEAIDGLDGLDFYVNNSAGHWDEAVTKVTSDGWYNSINTNLSACVFACREVARHLIEQKNGSILIVGSTCMYTPLFKEAGYRVSKTGLRAYMEVLAVELAPFGIRVNMVTPGLFITRVSAHLTGRDLERVLADIPLRRPGDLEKDIGPAAAFLLSDQLSGYTTGAELLVDGGVKLRPLPLYTYNEVRQGNL